MLTWDNSSVSKKIDDWWKGHMMKMPNLKIELLGGWEKEFYWYEITKPMIVLF